MLAAAALLGVAVGLGAWDIHTQNRLDDRIAAVNQEQRVLAALAAGADVIPLSGQGIRASLVRPRDGGQAYVVGQMPPVAAGKAYEAWIIHDGKPVAAGVFKVPSGYAVMPLEGDLRGAQAIAFTVERKQGESAPTSDIVAQAGLG
jgi:hypothetical protein